MARYCADTESCSNRLPDGKRRDAIYCSRQCAKRVAERRRRQSAKKTNHNTRADAKDTNPTPVTHVDPADSKDGRATKRKGRLYEEFLRDYPDLADKLKRRAVTVTYVCDMTGHSQTNVSRWQAALREELGNEQAQAEWSRDPEVDECLRNFKSFCLRYFSDDQDIGLLPDFHVEWADAITDTLNEGGRLLLLAPQRHGKTSLLIKYVMWRICRDPDICIMWVGKSENVASESTGLIRQYLEHHERMVREVFGPGITLVPDRQAGFSWTDTKLTISERTRIRKSPTLTALGITGNILGRDADLIVVDDPVEHRGNRGMTNPNNREEAYERLVTDVNSRKMKKTGFAYIGSRQHVDDPPGRIIKNHADDWRIMIYQAHDPVCTKPEQPYEEHDDCLLWSGADHIDFEWLMGQKRSNSAHFERNYMNNPQDGQLILVSAEDIERCKDYERRAGVIPSGVLRLVAGIDPADAKPVAAVLWGYEANWGNGKGRRHIIDIMEAEPGIRGGRKILDQWYQKYKCNLFVVEKNMANSWWQDADIREFIKRNPVHIKEHYTSRHNKMDDSTGVVAMFSHMREDPPSITIPWGDRETVEKMERIARTFLLFDPDYTGHKHQDDDLPMAAWFPQLTMDGWAAQQVQHAITEYEQTPYAWRTSYPSQSNKLIRRAMARSAA